MEKNVKDTKVVADIKNEDVEVVEKKLGKVKTFFKKNYKKIILGTVATVGVAYVGKTVVDVKNGKFDLLDDKEEPKIVEGVESEPTDEGSEE